MDAVIAREILAESLVRRTPTWRIADAILNLLHLADTEENRALVRALRRLATDASWYDQMNDDFDRVDPADTQLDTFAVLFPQTNIAAARTAIDVYAPAYMPTLRALVTEGLATLGIEGFETASAAMKARYGLDWTEGTAHGKKGFTKRLRFLRDFEGKLDRVQDTLTLRHAQMQAKSRLAYAVEVDKTDDISLALIAYLASRANRRSLFMLGGQSKAFDNIHEGLKALLGEEAAWDQIALVSPTRDVFARLGAEQRGVLAGVFHREMATAARQLARLYPHLPERMREEMVMVRGVDSSRWNAYAGALNTMRSAWISVSLVSGMGFLFDSYLPGKAPRLLASDLVWWARSMGQELHVDTRMFNALPKPWDVVLGEAALNRETILRVAAAEKVEDVEATGWIGPRARVEAEQAAAEPATVHGVIVGDPELARVLRRVGAFSGQHLHRLGELDELLAEYV